MKRESKFTKGIEAKVCKMIFEKTPAMEEYYKEGTWDPRADYRLFLRLGMRKLFPRTYGFKLNIPGLKESDGGPGVSNIGRILFGIPGFKGSLMIRYDDKEKMEVIDRARVSIFETNELYKEFIEKNLVEIFDKIDLYFDGVDGPKDLSVKEVLRDLDERVCGFLNGSIVYK